MPSSPCKCIDISHYQGRPNFTQVKAAGVLAMIHKATEGTGYSDADRATNCSNALKAGIAVCTYHFLKHGNADAQMDYYCSVIQPVDGERLIIDYEDSACTIGDLHEAVQQLLDKGQGKNWQITVYSGNLLKEQLGSSHDDFLAKNTDLWLAQYTSGTPSWPQGTYPTYSLWQYSESGIIPGISDASVDLNDFNGSDENLIKWIGPVGAEPAPPPVATLPQPLDQATLQQVLAIASGSAISRYSWQDRGYAPGGYINGMAVAWSTVLRKYLLNDPAALDMSKAKTTNADTDVLSWYAGKFADAGMDNSADGIDTLRHLFALQMGLGMRESSGQYCCGRDQSADNTDSMTCEAGMFQMSWNASSSTPLMQQVMDQYSNPNTGLCALDQFSEDVTCSAADWKCYGSGPGYDYQKLAKNCPQFAVETTLLGLRHIRAHWGPINRYEAELKTEADQMLADVQAVVMGAATV